MLELKTELSEDVAAFLRQHQLEDAFYTALGILRERLPSYTPNIMRERDPEIDWEYVVLEVLLSGDMTTDEALRLSDSCVHAWIAVAPPQAQRKLLMAIL